MAALVRCLCHLDPDPEVMDEDTLIKEYARAKYIAEICHGVKFD